jgi:hypothetical protein
MVHFFAAGWGVLRRFGSPAVACYVQAMQARKLEAPPVGPYRAADVRPGEPYEISDGYKIDCMSTGQRGARSNGSGFMVLDSDPAAPPAGVDAGVSPVPKMLRAPDVAVGGLADEPGWATTAPPLCVEYADRGQDEPDLQKKIVELLRCGTQFVWVVRMTGPRRVEVYESGKNVRTVLPGGALDAPGILQNAVPVEALYDRDAAHEQTLRNLLQRKGYADLDAVRDEVRREDLVRSIQDLSEVLAITPTLEQRATLASMPLAELDALRERLKRDRRW